MIDLVAFLEESNRIENIPTVCDAEVEAAEAFLNLSQLLVFDVERYVAVTQPGAILRRAPGLDVRVGRYYPPLGGPEIELQLAGVLEDAKRVPSAAWSTHIRYERLHPFTDGNGRSGRLIWLWQTMRTHVGSATPGYLPRGFLHQWYYDTLSNIAK